VLARVALVEHLTEAGAREEVEQQAERLAALRRAFEDTWKDPEYLAEAQRQQMEIEPMTGAEMQEMLERAYGRPRRIVERATELILPPNMRPN
jgi:tripartite-type tricarboxylate transporter receptor subunit TctC